MAETTLVTDLVCGQVVDADWVKYYSDYKGESYFFCCGQCKAAFDGDPEHFVRSQSYGPYH